MPLKQVEKTMDEYLVKKAPFQIPENGRKALTEWMPWIALIFGAIGLLATWGLYRTGQRVNEFAGYVDELSRAYGGPGVDELSFMYWVALLALVVQSVFLLVAYPGLKARSKARGWNLLLFGTLVSFVYGLFIAFTDQGSVGNLIGSIIGVVIGLYLLAQIRTHYK